MAQQSIQCQNTNIIIQNQNKYGALLYSKIDVVLFLACMNNVHSISNALHTKKFK